MTEIHHFTYGWFNPLVAFLMALVGSLLGLVCATRARHARTRGRSTRWLVLAAISIGGAAIWLMHFMAMLGFDVPDSPVRYDPRITFGSLGLAVAGVYAGLTIAVRGPVSRSRLARSGLFTGLSIFAMHYTGLYALRVAGEVRLDAGLLAASGMIAVVTSTVALWLALRRGRGWGSLLLGATVMGVAVCGSHYTAMAGVQIRLYETPAAVGGIGPFVLIVPITLLTAATLIAMAISALQAMTEEEFDGTPARHGAAAGVRWRPDSPAVTPWHPTDPGAGTADVPPRPPMRAPSAARPTRAPSAAPPTRAPSATPALTPTAILPPAR